MSSRFLALIFAIGGLGQIGLDGGSDDGLGPQAAPRFGIQAGQTWFQGDPIGSEIMLTRDLDWGWRGLGAVAAGSISDDGAAWAGLGLRWTLGSDRVWLESSLIPGLYIGDDPDLGAPLEFRSALAATFAFESGATVSVSIDHRSNGDIADLNPGLETIGVRWSWPLR